MRHDWPRPRVPLVLASLQPLLVGASATAERPVQLDGESCTDAAVHAPRLLLRVGKLSLAVWNTVPLLADVPTPTKQHLDERQGVMKNNGSAILIELERMRRGTFIGGFT